MTPRSLLRLEGLTVFAVSTYAFVTLDGQWWLYLLLILAPDLGMLGYLVDTPFGARTYNAAHTYVTPLVLAALGWWAGVTLLTLAALVWIAHIGIDRAIGYGLKYSTAFDDTHLDGLATPRG